VLAGTVQGQSDYVIEGLATLKSAQAQQLSFLANPLYRPALATTQAGCGVVTSEDAQDYQGQALLWLILMLRMLN
jgi:UDP-3-O-[3-hydroxymyristoyl] glucosamine N-acyltransferase